jgi:hypothetical protein
MIQHTTAGDMARRSSDARTAAQHIIEDARRGPEMGTTVEVHCAGLGRAQLFVVVSALFDELAHHA